MSESFTVMTRVINKFIELAKERKLTAAELNNKEVHHGLMEESFGLVPHEPFKNREELSKAHTEELDKLGREMRQKIQRMMDDAKANDEK
jgi:hypothetical protein